MFKYWTIFTTPNFGDKNELKQKHGSLNENTLKIEQSLQHSENTFDTEIYVVSAPPF